MREYARCSSVKNKANLSRHRNRAEEALVGQARSPNAIVGSPIHPTQTKSGGTPNPRRVGFAKQSQFLAGKASHYSTIPVFQSRPFVPNKANCPKRGTEAVSAYRVDPMDPESAGVCRSQPKVPCPLCGVEFSVPWGYDLWDASWLPSSRRKEGLCFLAGPVKGGFRASLRRYNGSGASGRPRQQRSATS